MRPDPPGQPPGGRAGLQGFHRPSVPHTQGFLRTVWQVRLQARGMELGEDRLLPKNESGVTRHVPVYVYIIERPFKLNFIPPISGTSQPTPPQLGPDAREELAGPKHPGVRGAATPSRLGWPSRGLAGWSPQMPGLSPVLPEGGRGVGREAGMPLGGAQGVHGRGASLISRHASSP